MPFHKKEVVILAFILAGSPAPTVSTQRGLQQSKLQVAMRADGFLDRPNSQSSTGISYVESATPFTWESVPGCARSMFTEHQPPPPPDNGMAELLPGVDAFYIIHDNRHEKRRSRLEKIMQNSRLGDHGLGELATWVTWFTQDELAGRHDMACVFNQSYAEPLFMASIGAPLSRNLRHLWIYHEMLRRQLRNVLVMEDNPVFRGGLEGAVTDLQALAGTMPSDTSIVMLGDADMSQGHPWRAAEIESSFVESHAKQKVSQHIYGPGLGQRGASGYLISGSSAASILQYIYQGPGVNAEADALMENALGPDGFYWYDPPLWVQSDSPLKVELESPASSGKSSATGPADEHNPEVSGQGAAYAQKNVTNYRWSRFHRYMGSAGDDFDSMTPA